MDRREDSRGPLSQGGAQGGFREVLSGEVVPCPRCGLLAPVLPPPPSSAFPESRCARGHMTVLVPAVHDYLRSLLGSAFS